MEWDSLPWTRSGYTLRIEEHLLKAAHMDAQPLGEEAIMNLLAGLME